MKILVIILNLLLAIVVFIASIKYLFITLKEYTDKKYSLKDITGTDSMFYLIVASHLCLLSINKTKQFNEFMQAIFIATGVQAIFYIMNKNSIKYCFLLKLIIVILLSCVIRIIA